MANPLRSARKPAKRLAAIKGKGPGKAVPKTATVPRVTRQNTRLGANLKALRMIKGLKLRDLSGRVGCSESLISKIENGVALPSVTVLHKIVSALNVSMAALFADENADRGIVARGGKRPAFSIDKAGSQLERLIPAEGRHLLEGNLHILAPGGGSEGLLSHDGEEVGFVVEGELELTVGDRTYLLAAGDSFTFRSEIPHSYRNPAKKHARIVWVSTPPTF